MAPTNHTRRRVLGLALAALAAAGCGLTPGLTPPGNEPPPPPPPTFEPLPENPGQQTVTFVARVFDDQNPPVQVIGRSIGITVTSLDYEFQPVRITDEQTGEVTEGIFEKPDGLAPYAVTIEPNPAVAYTTFSISTVVPKGYIVLCEVRQGPDEFGPLITDRESTPLDLAPGLDLGVVIVTCAYPEF